jgi:hypothetical protein
VFSVVFVSKTVIAPAVAAFVVALLVRRVSRDSRGVGAAAYAAGQTLGTAWMLYGTENWVPSRNLQWVPWLGVVAAGLGPILAAGGLASIERWILTLLAAAAAAAVLVPHWPDLWPPRPISIALFVLAASCVCRFSDPLVRRVWPRLIVTSMAAVSLVGALLISATFSLSVGEAALATAGALTGTAVALLFRPDEQAVRGLCLPYAIAVGGWCYVTAIEPSPPLVSLLCLPATLLVLWFAAVGPISHWPARQRLIVSVLLLVLTLATIGGWTWFSTGHGAEEYSLEFTKDPQRIRPPSRST